MSKQDNIILIHGTSQEKEIWQNVIDELKKEIPAEKIHNLDLLGFDKQTKQELNLKNWADDVQKYLDNNFSQPVRIIGLSFGGFLILELLRRGLKFEKVILIGTPYDGKFMSWHWRISIHFLLSKKWILRWLERKVDNNQNFLFSRLSHIFLFPKSIFQSDEFCKSENFKNNVVNSKTILAILLSLKEIMKSDMRIFLYQKHQMINILIGDKEKIVYKKYAEKWKEFPNVNFKMYSNCGHKDIVFQKAKEIANLIRE